MAATGTLKQDKYILVRVKRVMYDIWKNVHRQETNLLLSTRGTVLHRSPF